jgi:hypothetical protein
MSALFSMSPSEDKRDAVEVAGRPLRERWRAQAGQLEEAERALRRADREHDRALRKARRPGLARSSSRSSDRKPEVEADGMDAAAHRSRAIAETRTMLGSLDELLGEGEEVLDMAAGINAGHDGVLVVTDRRLIFVAPRRTLSLSHEDIARVEMRGRRWLGTRIAVVHPEGRATFSGIRQRHASELAELLDERSAVSEG